MATWADLVWPPMMPQQKNITIINCILKSDLVRILSYIWDMSDFLNKLVNNVLLVSLDVASLYTNILQQKGMWPIYTKTFLQVNAYLHVLLYLSFTQNEE